MEVVNKVGSETDINIKFTRWNNADYGGRETKLLVNATTYTFGSESKSESEEFLIEGMEAEVIYSIICEVLNNRDKKEDKNDK